MEVGKFLLSVFYRMLTREMLRELFMDACRSIEILK